MLGHVCISVVHKVAQSNRSQILCFDCTAKTRAPAACPQSRCAGFLPFCALTSSYLEFECGAASSSAPLHYVVKTWQDNE